MHPHHEPHALLAVVGIPSHRAYLVECGAGGLEHYLEGQVRPLVELAGDGVGVIGHLLQGGGAIQVLAADQEPHFQLFHQFHLGVLFLRFCLAVIGVFAMFALVVLLQQVMGRGGPRG